MSRLDRMQSERGTTLVEVMVGTASGLLVLAAVTMAIITTLHGSARVSARVHATQNARIAMTRIMEELHSACYAPKISPIQKGSEGSKLIFVRANPAEGTLPAPKPMLTEIVLSNGTLTQFDRMATNSAPPWEYGTATERRLLTGVSPVSPSSSIFTYHAYLEKAISSTPQAVPLTSESAAVTVQVRAALTASPPSTPVADKGAAASIRGTATLRLTPPSFNEAAPAPPCQ